MSSIGQELGMNNRQTNDTTARLRDTFDSVDYFEINTEKVKLNSYNIIIDKDTIAGSDTFILDHPALGKLGTGILGLGSSWDPTERLIENRIYQDFEEEFTSTGSFDTGNSTVTNNSSGSILFSGATTAASELTLHHKFNSNLNDSSSYDNDGVYTSGTYTSGKLSNCMAFDHSSSERSKLGSAQDAMNTSSDFTICVWAKKSASSSTYGDLFRIPNTSGGNNITLRIYNTGSTYITKYNGSSTLYWTVTPTTPTNWNHFAISYDYSENRVRTYRNGVQLTNGTGYTFIAVGSYNIDVGGPTYVSGSIDDFRIYNKVLDSGELGSIYNGGTGTESNVVGSLQTTDDVAQSLNLSSDLSIATLNKIKVDLSGSATNSMDLYGSLDGGENWESITNGIWQTLSYTGSDARWKVTSSVGSLDDVEIHWKSDDV